MAVLTEAASVGAAEVSAEAVLAEAGSCRILLKFQIVEFCINLAQDKLKTFKGVFNYDPADEKQVYNSFPNFAEEI